MGVVSFFYTLRGRKKSWRDRTRERHILNLEKDSHLERVLFNDQINLQSEGESIFSRGMKMRGWFSITLLSGDFLHLYIYLRGRIDFLD